MAQAIPYYYPGKFSPPNKYDLNIVKWLLRKTYDVASVTVVVGNIPSDTITIDQKMDLWDTFLNTNLDGQVNVIKDEQNSPLAAIYKIQERSPKDAFGIAITQDVAKNEDFKSTYSFFPNYEVIITPNYDAEAITSLKASIEQNDFKVFSKYMPDSMSVEEKHKAFKNIKPVEQYSSNPMMFESYWKEIAKSIANSVK